MINAIKLWLVAGEKAIPATPDAGWDGKNTVLVRAEDASNALKVARAYLLGVLDPVTMTINSNSIALCAMRNPVSGKFI